MTSLQAFKRLIREHRVVLTAVLLVAVVAFTGWRRLMVNDASTIPPPHAPGDADYTLRDFTLTLMNEIGEVGLQLSAEAMQHDPGTMRSEYVQPRVVLFESGQARWTGRADSGWAGDDQREIMLTGGVVLERLASAPSGPLTLYTQRLRLYPQAERAGSNVEVRVSQPGAEIQGTGMTLDFKQQRYRLKADVQGRYAIAESS